jgi:hypothetical protein
MLHKAKCDEGRNEGGVLQAWLAVHPYRITHRNVTAIATQHTRVQPLVAGLFVLHLVQSGRLLRFDKDGLVAPDCYLQRLASADSLLWPKLPCSFRQS